MDNQQFGQWLRAAQFSSSRKQTIEVKGFVDDRTKALPAIIPGPVRSESSRSLEEGKSNRVWLGKQVAEAKAGLVGGQKITATNPKDSMIVGIENTALPPPDFEAIIEEIDNAINVEFPTPDPMGERTEMREAQGLLLIKNKEEVSTEQGLFVDTRKVEVLISGKDGMSNDKGSGLYGDTEGEFVMGWADPNAKNKKGKQGKGKKVLVEAGNKVATGGPNFSPPSTKGSWTRQLTRPMQESHVHLIQEEVGSKRKLEEPTTLNEHGNEGEKRLKVTEETKKLSALFATHLGSAEVAKQPRRVQ